MPNSIIPTQIGGLPVGSAEGSQVVLGRDSTVTFEAIGLGEKGRPDFLQKVVINLSKLAEGNYTKLAKIIIDVAAIEALIEENENIPENLEITLTEVSICEIDEEQNNIEKKMMILGSQTYLPPES